MSRKGPAPAEADHTPQAPHECSERQTTGAPPQTPLLQVMEGIWSTANNNQEEFAAKVRSSHSLNSHSWP